MKHRRPLKITSRTSSVTNGFVQAIIPADMPNSEDHAKVLATLGVDTNNPQCIYCGDKAQHWDHLNPFVRNKRPSGFLHEARNIVPSCGPCNTSKSGQAWKAWMAGSAKGSPRTRGVRDLAERIARLEQLEEQTGLKPLDLGQFVEPDLWARYWQRLDEIEKLMFQAQSDAEQISQQIQAGIKAAL